MKKINDLESMKTKNDERYTPPCLVEVIVKYIPKNKIVWCPFDTEDSEFVRVLRENKIKVVNSHIWEGKDFFSYEPKKWDLIISNPPFSCKLKVLERLYNFGKPFAILMGLPVLNYQEIGEFFLQ